MLESWIQNGRLLGGRLGEQGGNAPPPGVTGQQRPYFAPETRRFLAQTAPYATDFFAAQVQGLDPSEPEKIVWYEIRAGDQFTSLSTSEISGQDDWKNVFFRRADVDYVPPGTKFWFWNNCWLAVNPSNIGSAAANTLVRRCNAVWNSLDEYGNLVSEPFSIQRPSTHANSNGATSYMQLAENYSDCVMQANPWTLAHLRQNTRIAMGTGIYAVRGLSDYIREFTGEKGSVRLLRFSIEYQEPTKIDDMERLVAGGRAFTWEIRITAPESLPIGTSVTLGAQSIRNGEAIPASLPVSYQWSSLDPDIAAADPISGQVSGLQEGASVIRCTLMENPSIYQEIKLEVLPHGEEEPLLYWKSPPPLYLPMGEQISLQAALDKPVTWSFSGPNPICYSAEADGDSAVVQCFYPDNSPLVVTVSEENGQTLSAKIQLTAS